MANIPGYELLDVLSTGPQTVVHAASCLESDSPCAVKMLRPAWKDHPSALKLLQREARVLLGARHPHLIHLRRAFVIRSPHFLVMDRLEGESLRQCLHREKHISCADGLRLLHHLAEAVVFVNRAGFVHGDIKPDNIFLQSDGNTVLLDLGLARRIDDSFSLEPGVVLGSPLYLAPELCRLEPLDHPRSDIYSLGLTIFEALTGQLPFSGQCLEEIRHQRQFELPALLGEFLSNVPASLERLVGRMLSPSPFDRPHPQRILNELLTLEVNTAPFRLAS